MRILITGADGQLGRAIMLHKNPADCLFGYNSNECDIINLSKVSQIFENTKPDVVIHCAAYTSVDKAEVEITKCKEVNIQGSINIAKACQNIGAKLVFLSSDYVFNGEKQGLYEIDDQVAPLSIYGLTKAIAEKEVSTINSKTFIVRTSWMFGDGKNFVNTMLTLAKTHDFVTVVNDQIGSPTYADDLAKFLYQLIHTEKYGTYHVTNEGFCSWAELARKVFELKDIRVKVIPVSSEEYGSLAKRPKNSRLSKKSITDNGFSLLPAWESSLKDFLKM